MFKIRVLKLPELGLVLFYLFVFKAVYEEHSRTDRWNMPRMWSSDPGH